MNKVNHCTGSLRFGGVIICPLRSEAEMGLLMHRGATCVMPSSHICYDPTAEAKVNALRPVANTMGEWEACILAGF